MGIQVGCDILGYKHERVKEIVGEVVPMVLDYEDGEKFVEDALNNVGRDTEAFYTVGYVLGSYVGVIDYENVSRVFKVIGAVLSSGDRELAKELATKLLYTKYTNVNEMIGEVAVTLLESETPDEFMQNVLKTFGDDGVKNKTTAYIVGFLYGAYVSVRFQSAIELYFTTVRAIKEHLGGEKAKRFVNVLWDLAMEKNELAGE